MIAMAIAMKPALIIADEPTTALDVTIQAQILDLLSRLQREFAMSLILITHDLGMVAEHADKVAVMYAGHMVETAGVDDLYYNPLHPYALGLLGSIATAGPGAKGEAEPHLRPAAQPDPRPLRLPLPPPLRLRATPVRTNTPDLLPRTGDPTHPAACHFAGDSARAPRPREDPRMSP